MKAFYFSAALFLAICGALSGQEAKPCVGAKDQPACLARFSFQQERKPKGGTGTVTTGTVQNRFISMPECSEGTWREAGGILILSCYEYPTSAKIVISEPFDRKPEEWDGPDVERQRACDGGFGYFQCTEFGDFVPKHHSACVISGTHQPDPQRFPIADATGKIHCLALLQR